MAILKNEYNELKVDIGEDLEDVQKEQLTVTLSELTKALNQENLVDRVFARVLRNRSKSQHQALLDAMPGAAGTDQYS